MQRSAHDRSISRDGFTVVEVVVTIAILAILLAMILPAVQGVRETARRTTCSSHLHQLSVALEAHARTHREYPDAVELTTELLPAVEQKALYDRIRSGSPLVGGPPRIELFVCPSDDQDGLAPDAISYGANMGSGPQAFGMNGFFLTTHHNLPIGSPPVLSTSPRVSRPSDITDGLSQTVAISEFLLINPFAPVNDVRRTFWQFSPDLTGPTELATAKGQCAGVTLTSPPPTVAGGSPRGFSWAQNSGSYTLATYHHVLPPNSPSCGGPTFGFFSTGSNHNAGALSLFGDGHIAFMADSIDASAWAQLGSRESTSPIMP